MEGLVVTLETAKKLEAAGFPQDTHFRWTKLDYGASAGMGVTDKFSAVINIEENKIKAGKFWAAPTAQEVANQLDFNSNEHMFAAADNYDGKKMPMAEMLALLWLRMQKGDR